MIMVTKKEIDQLLKKHGFKKTPYRPIWTNGDYKVTTSHKGNGYHFYFGLRKIGSYLVFHEWNNWLRLKHDIQDIVG